MDAAFSLHVYSFICTVTFTTSTTCDDRDRAHAEPPRTQTAHPRHGVFQRARLLDSRARPRNVGHLQPVVGALEVVAKIRGTLPLDAAHAATAEGDLTPPDGTRAALGQNVVFGAEEQVRHQSPADATCTDAVAWGLL